MSWQLQICNIKEEIIIGERGRIDCRDEEERKLRLF
jgi:hypothetical protein